MGSVNDFELFNKCITCKPRYLYHCARNVFRKVFREKKKKNSLEADTEGSVDLLPWEAYFVAQSVQVPPTCSVAELTVFYFSSYYWICRYYFICLKHKIFRFNVYLFCLALFLILLFLFTILQEFPFAKIILSLSLKKKYFL